MKFGRVHSLRVWKFNFSAVFVSGRGGSKMVQLGFAERNTRSPFIQFYRGPVR